MYEELVLYGSVISPSVYTFDVYVAAVKWRVAFCVTVSWFWNEFTGCCVLLLPAYKLKRIENLPFSLQQLFFFWQHELCMFLLGNSSFVSILSTQTLCVASVTSLKRWGIDGIFSVQWLKIVGWIGIQNSKHVQTEACAAKTIQ